MMSADNSTHVYVPDGTLELRTVEMFGPTIQGEGPTVGQAAYFLRLAGCNLNCVWCDTAFSWDVTREDPDRLPTQYTVEELLHRLDPRANEPSAVMPVVRRLVITGGEPLLQATALLSLCARLRQLGWFLELETSGSVSPIQLRSLIDQFNVSPKLVHSGVAERARLRWPVLDEFAMLPQVTFKFVVSTLGDLTEVANILEHLSTPVDPSRVMIMAEGNSPDVILERSRDLVDCVAARGWGLTPRWHTLLWGDERGR